MEISNRRPVPKHLAISRTPLDGDISLRNNQSITPRKATRIATNAHQSATSANRFRSAAWRGVRIPAGPPGRLEQPGFNCDDVSSPIPPLDMARDHRGDLENFNEIQARR